MSSSDNRPIGVFDSGLGGISVLKDIIKILPNENIVYLGDNLNNPYGTKTKEEILNISLEAGNKLIEYGVKAIVVACNTATSAAINELRKIYSIPIIGMEPAIKPAVMGNKNGRIAVLATISTLKENKFNSNMEKYQKISNIYKIPTQELVELVENDIIDGPEIKKVLDSYFNKYSDISFDAIVLGCTHFIFLKREIYKYFDGIKIYDGNIGTVNRLKDLLVKGDILNLDGIKGNLQMIFTKDNSRFCQMATQLIINK